MGNKAIHPVVIFMSGIKLWQKNIGVFSGVYLVIYLPIIAISLLVYFIFPPTGEKPVVHVNLLMNMAVGLIIMLMSLWGAIALMLAGAKAFTEMPIKVSSALAETRRYFFRYIAANVLFLVLLGGIGLGFVVVVGIESRLFVANIGLGIAALLFSAIPFAFALAYFIIRLSLFGYACVLEDKGPLIALKRSHALIKNHITPVVGLYCLLMLLGIFYFIPLALVWFLAKDARYVEIMSNIVSYLVGIIFAPIATMASVILYYKLKEIAQPDVHP